MSQPWNMSLKGDLQAVTAHTGLEQQLPQSQYDLQNWHVVFSGLDKIFLPVSNSRAYPFLILIIMFDLVPGCPENSPSLRLCSGTLHLVIAWVTIPERNLRISIIGMNKDKKSSQGSYLCETSLLAFNYDEISQSTQMDLDTVPESLYFFKIILGSIGNSLASK